MKKKIILKGKFCYLGELSKNDYLKLYKLRIKQNGKKMVRDISLKKINQKNFIQEQINKGNYIFGIFVDKKLVGAVSIYNISKNKIAELGRFVTENQSIAVIEAHYLILKFAIEKLKLKKVIATVVTNNTKSVKMHNFFLWKILSINKYQFFSESEYKDMFVYFHDKNTFKKIKNKLKNHF